MLRSVWKQLIPDSLRAILEARSVKRVRKLLCLNGLDVALVFPEGTDWVGWYPRGDPHPRVFFGTCSFHWAYEKSWHKIIIPLILARGLSPKCVGGGSGPIFISSDSTFYRPLL